MTSPLPLIQPFLTCEAMETMTRIFPRMVVAAPRYRNITSRSVKIAILCDNSALLRFKSKLYFCPRTLMRPCVTLLNYCITLYHHNVQAAPFLKSSFWLKYYHYISYVFRQFSHCLTTLDTCPNVTNFMFPAFTEKVIYMIRSLIRCGELCYRGCFAHEM